jgi:hypothetical protein
MAADRGRLQEGRNGLSKVTSRLILDRDHISLPQAQEDLHLSSLPSWVPRPPLSKHNEVGTVEAPSSLHWISKGF